MTTMKNIAAHYKPETIVHADPLTAYGGYTILSDKSLLVIAEKPSLPTSVQRKELNSFILLGTEYAADGSSLNLDRGEIALMVMAHNLNNLEWCEGVWLHPEGHSVIEQALLLRCPDTHEKPIENRQRDVIAERLRVLFRQHCIICVNSRGEAFYITE